MTTSPSRPLALVTGASTGIGRELAKQFACNDFDLIVTAKDGALDDAARELEALGASVDSIRLDLPEPGGVDELWAFVAGRPLAAAALNAGRGAGGAFVGATSQTRLVDELEIVDLNVRSTVHIAKYVLGDVVARGEGRVRDMAELGSARK
jgi:short-subunit dehydrogenase